VRLVAPPLKFILGKSLFLVDLIGTNSFSTKASTFALVAMGILSMNAFKRYLKIPDSAMCIMSGAVAAITPK
jgi:hypothetical protein